MEVAPIVEVDHRIVADGKPGKVFKQLKDLFVDITRGRNKKYMDACTPVYKK